MKLSTRLKLATATVALIAGAGTALAEDVNLEIES